VKGEDLGQKTIENYLLKDVIENQILLIKKEKDWEIQKIIKEILTREHNLEIKKDIQEIEEEALLKDVIKESIQEREYTQEKKILEIIHHKYMLKKFKENKN